MVVRAMSARVVVLTLACTAAAPVSKKHVTGLFVHVESEMAARMHANKPSLHNQTLQSELVADDPHKKAEMEEAAEAERHMPNGFLRAATEQEMQAAQKRAGEEMHEAASVGADPDLKAAALRERQAILTAQEKAGARALHEGRSTGQQSHPQQQRPEVLPGSCPECGQNIDGVLNCCSHGGTWENTCTSLISEGGEHTWIDGFNACKEIVPPEPEQLPKPAEPKERKHKEEQEQTQETEDQKFLNVFGSARETEPSKDRAHKGPRGHRKDNDESKIEISVNITGSHGQQLKGLKGRKGFGRTSKKELDKESSISVSEAQDDAGEEEDLSPDEKSAREFEKMDDDERRVAEIEEEAKAAADAARQEKEQEMQQQQEQDDDLSPDEKAALQYEADEAAEAAEMQKLRDNGIDPEEEKRKAERKAKKEAEAEAEANQLRSATSEEMEVAQRAAIVREASDRAREAREAAAKEAAEKAKKGEIDAATEQQDADGEKEGLLRAPTAQELAKQAQQAAQQGEADREITLRPPTPEELEKAAEEKASEGNTAEAYELEKKAKEAAEAGAGAKQEETGLLRPPTPEELAKAEDSADGAEEVAKLEQAKEAVAREAADKVAAEQEARIQAETPPSPPPPSEDEEGEQQQGEKLNRANWIKEGDEKPEMNFRDYFKSMKQKSKLDYDPNDGVVADEPKKKKEDLATKVAEMNKAAQEKNALQGQDDELENGQLRVATKEEQDAKSQSQQSQQGKKKDDGASVGDDGVPDRMKAWEGAIDKKLKEAAAKGADRGGGAGRGGKKGDGGSETDASSAAGALAAAGMSLSTTRGPDDATPPSPNYDQEYDRVMP